MPQVEVEEHYQPPSHLEVQQSWGPFPGRFILPITYATIFGGGFLGISTFEATHGLILPSIAAAATAPMAVSPFAAWWLDPPAEHGLFAFSRFIGRSFVAPSWPEPKTVAVYRMPTLNLSTSGAVERRQARIQWGVIVNSLRHPIKIIVRGRPIQTLPAIQHLQSDPRPVAQKLGRWMEQHIATAGLIERDRLLVIPAAAEAELHFRTQAIERNLRQARFAIERISPDALPLLRTLTWNPKATEASAAPEVMQELSGEVHTDGWWTRAYDLGKLPPAILTDWLAPLLSGEEPLDVAIDLVPRDADDIKTWTLQPQINRLSTSVMTVKRRIALEQLHALYDALERRKVVPFEMGITVLVRGNSRQDVRARSRRVEQIVETTGGKLRLLKWEQAAGLQQLDPARPNILWQRRHITETGTVARTYPWSDAYLQLDDGVPWGEAGARPCIFSPYCRTNKGPHMCWYGATNAGKGTGAHMLWARLHLLKAIRIFGIDQDEQHEHCGRFLEYLGGRKLAPRDAQDAREIVLHRDDGVVIIDLSERTESESAAIFAEWVEVVKRHMLAYPGRSIVFVDEATRLIGHPAAEKAMRFIFERSRHWGQSSHALTQRPSTWFGSEVGRAVQGNSDAWWCGGQLPRELSEVADGLELSDEEREFIRKAGIGQGLLVSGHRRVALDLFQKLSPDEYAAFYSDPVVERRDDDEDSAGGGRAVVAGAGAAVPEAVSRAARNGVSVRSGRGQRGKDRPA